ncbi:hypothetical protein M422DRAFT_63007 [Sphaerobolus stellatus SS14]|nr:hypothetical protein M422DRAFT_63007 [Sphaerobolus stellatus SS14]
MSAPIQEDSSVPAATANGVEDTAAVADADIPAVPPPAVQPNPNVKLPPAAARLTNLDFDPQGNPYYKFPPYISPPEGVTIVSFEAFLPAGIELVLDPDEDEYDGMGIPTVMLGAKHVPLAEKDKKKKKKKKKDDDNSKVQRKESTWWEDWAEGEDLRRAEVYNPNVPRSERFAQGAAEFQHGRHWKPAAQSVYDHFRHFAGLKTNPSSHRFGRRDRHNDADAQAEEEEDDEVELSAEMKREQDGGEEEPSKIMSDDEEDEPMDVDKADPDTDARMLEIQAEIERRELRLDNFLNEPERMVRIFFSSFYKEKGLFWSKHRCRDGPLILQFFLNFFIRNRIMPDYQRVFEAALRAVNLAAIELPLSSKISVAIPDSFGKACTALWGTRMPQPWIGEDWNFDTNKEGAAEAVAAADAVDENGENGAQKAPESKSAEVLDPWEQAMRDQGAERIDISTLPPPPDSDIDGNGWGTNDGTNGWGNGGNDDAAWPLTDSWADASDPTKQDPAAGWEEGLEPTPCLLSLVGGPTSLPLTHAPALIEKSTRRILDFSPPDASAPSVLNKKFGIMRLAPWKIEEGMEGILPPEIVGREGVAEGTEADARADVIKVYVDMKAIEVLREGMGIFGLWVRVNEVPPPEEEKDEGAVKEKKEGGGDKKKRKKKGKGKASGDGDDKVFWYAEMVFEVLPSFWTEPQPHEIVEGT